VADTGIALLAGRRYHAPHPQLSERPYRAVVQDMERFHSLCDALGLGQDTRVTLGDVEHGPGWRVGLCLWAVADAMQQRAPAAGVPAFASPEEHARLRSSAPRGAARQRVAQFDHRDCTPLKLPPNTAHLVASPRAPPAAAGATPPPSPPRRQPAPAESAEDGGASDGGLDVLVSILSPEKIKPAHTQLLNAIMRSNGAAPPAPAAASAAARGKVALEGAENGGAGEDPEGSSGRRPRAAGRGHAAPYLRVLSPRAAPADVRPRPRGEGAQGAGSGGAGSGGSVGHVSGLTAALVAGGVALAAVVAAAAARGGGGGGGRSRGGPRAGGYRREDDYSTSLEGVHQGRW
jgi:hypothetical protein